ncbi:tryptophan synthase subunit alpha [Robiginitomaculum antarcticum]|uniref:tryptophan synthase subunit alpha n=1 Tax=Robiginitomaculum antarcticum TaxID=437507 RepID=UPI00037C343B|nr:tryptophan synthase subunit alpha [Robiginitomaculum antarcticum]
MTQRLNATFSKTSTVFVAYIMGGDPDRVASQRVMNALPAYGVDIIELGIPFTDPMADGPVIEEAGIRARKSGTTLKTILDMAADFRRTNSDTPIILMGYFNPIHQMGEAEFAKAAHKAGVDGAIIVDLPPEEDAPLRKAFEPHDLALIRLATPTTDAARLPDVVRGTKGFVYYVSMTGVTGTALSGDGSGDISAQVAAVRKASGLPVVVGFGVKTPERAAQIGTIADGVVVGTAIVKALHEQGEEEALALVKSLADGAHSA